MFGKQANFGVGNSGGDERLKTLLQAWKCAEPPGNFESNVWRRIRAGQPVEERRYPALTVLQDWLAPRPVWTSLLAAAAGILLGIGLGIAMPGRPHPGHDTGPLLNSRTLAGSYLTMMGGTTP